MHILSHVGEGDGIGAGAQERPRFRVSDRSPEELRRRLEPWLSGQFPGAEDVRIDSVHAPPANGMSSQSLLLDVRWRSDGRENAAAWVARIAPAEDAWPVYPRYDLERQFRTLRAIAAAGIPAPRALWLEPSGDLLGAPFLVMERVYGQVPPDVMPYTFEGWVLDASAEQRARMQQATIRLLARLHAVDPQRFGFLEPVDSSAATPLGRHLAAEASYVEWIVEGDARSPLLDRGFEWLRANVPAEEGPPVVTWGDARIGNVMYRDFEPVAVFDWETAALAPAELDLAWFVWLHWSFQDLAVMAGLPGLPDFLRVGEVISGYARAGGRPPQDFHWHLVYAAIRHSAVMSRVGRRMVAFGERKPVGDIDELVFNRRLVEKLLDGQWPDWAD